MLISLIRSIFLYLVLILVVRLMGKRQIGEMEPSEFVVTMLIANLAAVPMQDNAISLFSGLVPILAVLGLELVLAALSLKQIPLRRLLCGKPVILIENGKILQQNLQKTRINLDELTGQLREQEVLDLSTVKYAILETNGKLSVFLYAKHQPVSAMDAGIQVEEALLPYTLVSDGKLLEDNLRLSGHTRVWLEDSLRSFGGTVEDTFLFTVDAKGKTYFSKKEQAT